MTKRRHFPWLNGLARYGPSSINRNLLLFTICALLILGFWISPDFQVISAGVAIFVFGMISLEKGFRASSGGYVAQILNRATDRLWKSLSFGIISTALMQSSSLISVLTISFLSAELIPLASGIGIIFGANIGTTSGAWLIAGLGHKANIAAYGMPMLVFGVLLIFQSSGKLKSIGQILVGLGFLFLGFHYMKQGFSAFQGTIDLAQLAITGIVGVLVYALVGAVATVIMQSSHATIALIVAALAAQQVTYENALALAIGANIGTTVTAVLGALGANRQGRQLAAGHVIFNVTSAIVAIIFIHQFTWAVDVVSAGVGIGTHDFTLKLAVFHSLFNIVGVALMLPLTGRLIAFLETLFTRPRKDVAAPRYLNKAVLETPDALLAALHNEIVHLFDNAFEAIAHALNLHRHTILSDRDLETYVAHSREVMDFDLDAVYDARVKTLYAAILDFVGHAQPVVSSGPAAVHFNALRDAARLIVESVKHAKHLRKNLSRFIVSRNESIRTEYNLLRVRLATILRELDHIRRATDPDTDVLDLDELLFEVESYNKKLNGTLDRLIREDRISGSMASSLTNDMSYARSLAWNLAEIGKILFAAKDPSASRAEKLVALDKEEIDKLSATAGTAPKSENANWGSG